MAIDSAHPQSLPAELSDLIRSMQLRVHTARPLTTLASSTMERAAFKLTLEDGRRLKGRVVRTESEAVRIEALARYLDRNHFPAVVGRRGRALLLDWVDGEPIAGEGQTPAFFEACGEIFGALHATALPADVWERFVFPRHYWPGRAGTNVSKLFDLKVLSVAEAARANEILAEVPTAQPSGLIHGDFCIENLVVDSAGKTWVIDNENITIEAPDYDALRAWYRWPMNDAQASAFKVGYQKSAEPLHLSQTLQFWGVAAFAEATTFRIEGQTGGEEAVLNLLRRAIQGDLSVGEWA